jgi:4-methyl-5(b-hydroxyethyl)-thiazole monophosphate biosynthesis
MIIVLLAEGFEEIEALTPVDMLRRASLTIKTVGISGKTVMGAHGISVACDLLPDEVDLSLVDMVILPGGMPGTLNLFSSPFTEKAVRSVLEANGRVAAICAAPLILGRYGLLNGVVATCYPGFENELRGAILVDKDVITFDNITTARGMGVAAEFSLELIRLLCDESTAAKISNAICRRNDDFLIF